MKRIIALAALGFGLTLGGFVGYKVSSDALALMIGVILGIVATIPISVLVVWALRRQAPIQGQGQPSPYPPVVVVQPGSGAVTPPWGQAQTALPPPSGTRRFNIIGHNDDVEPASVGGTRSAWADD